MTRWWSILGLLLACACSSETAPPSDSGVRDAQPESDATNTGAPDAIALGDAGSDDAETADATDDATTPAADATTSDPDAATPGDDAGTGLALEMEPGSHVQVSEARILIGDTFATVRQKLGAGTRTAAMNTRSYEWTLANNIALTIWFANTNLDDDAPPADVDDSDRALWIAVTPPFTGRTSKQLGLGSTRAAIEAAAPAGYGPPQHTTALTMPAGTLAAYYTTGFLVAYEPNDTARTFTITRAYQHAPDGDIEPDNAQLDFGAAGRIQGLRGWVDMPLTLRFGTNVSDVMSRLGAPDGQGPVTVANQQLELLSYGFIGIEVFASNTGSLRTAFVSVHAPYYGTLNGAGINSTRAQLEAALGRGTGLVSAMNAQFVCYEGNQDPDVAVTYSTDAIPVVTSITIPLIRDSDSTTCP